MTSSEKAKVVNDFVKWLMSRKETIFMGVRHNIDPINKLVDKFLIEQKPISQKFGKSITKAKGE